MTGISTKKELFETVRQLEVLGHELAQTVWSDPEISGEEVRASGRFRELFRAAFLDERWKGMRPVAWGDTLREAQLTAAIYEGLCGLDKAVNIEGKEDLQ